MNTTMIMFYVYEFFIIVVLLFFYPFSWFYVVIVAQFVKVKINHEIIKK